jgi:DNA-binding MarR family transcriptional regulator
MAAVDPGVLPTLLRGARATYSRAIGSAVVEAGYDDIPRHGSFLLGAVSPGGSPLSQIIEWLGISKQAAGQVVDSLVTRGYLERVSDPEDRRRLTLTLTERGEYAATVSRTASRQVQHALNDLVGPEDMETTLRTLRALASLGREGDAPGMPASS